MKDFLQKAIFSLLLFFSPLTAQEAPQEAQKVAEDSGDWKSWTFGGVALVTAGIGIFIVALDQGSTSQSH